MVLYDKYNNDNDLYMDPRLDPRYWNIARISQYSDCLINRFLEGLVYKFVSPNFLYIGIYVVFCYTYANL